MNYLPPTDTSPVLCAPLAMSGARHGYKHNVLPSTPSILTAATPHQISPLGKAAPTAGVGVQALLAEAAQLRAEEDGRRLYFSHGRFGDRARVGLLAVRKVDALNGAVRTLGFVPITGIEDQQAIYGRTAACLAPPVSESGGLQHSFRLDRLSPDASSKIVESKPVSARTAVLMLLIAPGSRAAEELLADAGLEAFLEYFDKHPVQPPGSTRRHRRGAHRAGRRQPLRGWV